MADIAAIFQWPLSDMYELELYELASWHEKALDRYNRMNGVKRRG